MATHTQAKVRRDLTPPPRVNVARPVVPGFTLPPKASRVLPKNDEISPISSTAVDGAGDPIGGTPAEHDHAVRVTEMPAKREPVLKQSLTINLANAAPSGGLAVGVGGNTVFYADSTLGTDRLNVQYQKSQGDQSQPQRVMVPGRIRREASFSNLLFTWTVTAGSTATVEIYDDPDRTLDIEG